MSPLYPPPTSPELRADAEALSVTAFRRIDFAGPVRTLSALRPVRSLVAILFDWTCIVAIATAAQRYAPIWSWPLAWLLIATRQHALLILMHDASHGLLSRRRGWNDAVADVCCAWPMFVRTAAYRESHLRHHRFLNSERDPDLVRKVTEPGGRERWLTTRARWRNMAELLLDVCGRGLFEMLAKLRRFQRQGAGPTTSGPNARPSRARSAWRLAYYTTAALVITALEAWTSFALFWLVPLFTFLPAILRLRSLAEHFGLGWDHELTSARAVRTGPLQRFLFGPHWTCLHLEHHLFPSVPWYHLPKLHRVLMQDPEFASRAAVSRGYLWGEPSVIGELATTTAKAPWTSND
jgi:fatty acid desaturase